MQRHLLEFMHELILRSLYITRKENVVIDSLSRRPFVDVVSLVRDTMFDNIKYFYRNDVFLFICFESLSKKSRTQEEIYTILPMSWMQELYI